MAASSCRVARTVGQASLTVPNRATPDADGNSHDFAGLTQCMVAIRQQWAAEVVDDHSINVSPNGDIPYGVLVKTVDAVRESRGDACHLPENGGQGNYTSRRLPLSRGHPRRPEELSDD